MWSRVPLPKLGTSGRCHQQIEGCSEVLTLPHHPLLLYQSSTFQAPSASDSPWKRKSSFMAEKKKKNPQERLFSKNPQESVFSPPLPQVKGNYLTLLPTTHAAAQTQRWAPTGARWLQTLEMREVGRTKIFPLTAPGSGAGGGSGMRSRHRSWCTARGVREDAERCRVLG